MEKKGVFEERAHRKSFNELIDEWITETKKTIGQEVRESMEPRYANPSFEPPIPSRMICNTTFIKWFASGLGDDNPLYTDPEYAKKTKYGCLIAPPSILIAIRYTPSHGVAQPATPPFIPYPIGPLFAGTEFYWFDVIRVRDRFKTSIRLKEILEKKGRTAGRLLFTVTDGFYWNQHGDLTAKARGHLIEVPIEAYLDSERIGEQMLYDRPIYSYTKEEIERIIHDVERSQDRKGATSRYWEEVEVGDKLPIVVKAPSMTVTDQVLSPQHLPWRHPAFELAYRDEEEEGRPHPVTKVPWGATAEHEDAMLCRFRGLPGPFDYGAHRVIWTSVAVTNWMGDNGFLRKMRADLRKPNYYGDTTWFKAEVVKKYKVKETGDANPGGVPGEAEYAAVLIKSEGVNQIGELTVPGYAVVYLPSHELGPVKLPIPHKAQPDYIPFASLRLNEL